MRRMRWMGLVLAAVIAMGTATACSNEGPAEKAGKALDKAAEQTEQAADEAKEEVEEGLGE